jgi:AcrR family transcriptional regulator
MTLSQDFLTKSSKVMTSATVLYVSDQPEASMNRLERRKQRTRGALIKAAQGFIAAGRPNVPVLEITQAADVGMGSFYNHFESKEELFEAAVADVLDNHGALLDALTASIDDPAETFACSYRLTGRLFRRRPTESQILLANGMTLLASGHGLAPRAKRDIEEATPDWHLPSQAARSWGWAICCGVSPTEMTPPPPTKSPKTCCVCSGFPPTRLAKSADVHYPISRASANPTRPRDAAVRRSAEIDVVAKSTRTFALVCSFGRKEAKSEGGLR